MLLSGKRGLSVVLRGSATMRGRSTSSCLHGSLGSFSVYTQQLLCQKGSSVLEGGGRREASTWMPSFGSLLSRRKPTTTITVSTKQQPRARRLLQALLARLPGMRAVPAGYWEALWPRLQIEAARYGLAGGGGLGALLLLKLSMGVSTFLVEFLPYSWHASAGATGGLLCGASVAALFSAADRFLSLHASDLQRHSFATVRKDFFVERALGGAVHAGGAMTSAVTPAEIYLTERSAPGFLKAYALRYGSVDLVFTIYGPAGAASVFCSATKAAYKWQVSKLVVEFDSNCSNVPPEKRLLVLQGEETSKTTPPSPLQRAASLHTEGGGQAESTGSASYPVLKLRTLWDAVLLRS